MAGKKILLDAPTDRPTLGYANIARTFAGIITDSRPRFAIGIFGGWGSGKTTLMGAIKSELTGQGIVTVDFNAWRFEREPQLLVPLLDTIRAAVIDYAQRDPNTAKKVRAFAERLGRIVRALASGLSGSAGIPHAITVNYEAKAALDALDALAGSRDGFTPKSLYVSAFEELRAAFSDLTAVGVTRIVVFVDDLDRCFPAGALDVLESIKLFFDFPGFIFVVGMDDTAIDRAIEAKLAASPAPTDSAHYVGRLGREYAKKIFQIPYSLPVMLPEQLDNLLPAMYSEAGIDGEQLADLHRRVRPYLDVIAIERRVNPREVKRFINSYTLQTLIRPDLKPEAVLALQTMAFRLDWYQIYNALITHPNRFRDALRNHRNGGAFKELFPDLMEFPEELNSFLLSDLIKPLADEPDFDTYTSSLDAAEVPRTLRAPEPQQPNAEEQIRLRSGQLASTQAQLRPSAPPSYQEQIDALSAQLAALQGR
jgi:KAP family P-loop domain